MPRPRNKYRNVPTVVDGRRFDSKLEAKVYQDLCLEYGRENVVCQVSIPIGAQRIRPDFMVIVGCHPMRNFKTNPVSDGPIIHEILFIDAKGRETQAWKAKANCLKALHGIEIQLRRK